MLCWGSPVLPAAVTRLAASAALLLGLLVVAASASAKVVEVPATPEFRSGNTSAASCQAFVFLQWPEQKGAKAWRIEYVKRGRTYTKTLSPPFSDEDGVPRGWLPAAGTHWYKTGFSGGSFPGHTVECESRRDVLLPEYGEAKVFVTLADDAKIVGKVTDTDGDPVSGVRVRAKGAGADRTDAEGEYEIDVPERTGTYVVTPSLRDVTFRPRRRSLTVKAGQTKRANFRARFERAIAGRVRMGCAGQTACSILPVAGVKVRATRIGKGPGARRYTATTDDSGRYKLRVKKGRYRVQTTNAVMNVTPGRKTLNLTRKKKGIVSFKACTIKSGGASLNAVATGAWTSPRSCGHHVTVNWSVLRRTLSFTWQTAPSCIRVKNGVAGKAFVPNRLVWAAGPGPVPISPDAGSTVNVGDERIGFQFAVPSDTGAATQFPFDGEILANGTGTVNGIIVRQADDLRCTFEMKGVPLRRS